jgi:copper(I)-binding protein
VIVAVPTATEVTRPAVETVATDELEVVHVTVGLGIVAPSASVTVGTNVAVSPSDANDRLVGASTTLDAT